MFHVFYKKSEVEYALWREWDHYSTVHEAFEAVRKLKDRSQGEVFGDKFWMITMPIYLDERDEIDAIL